MSEKQKYFDFEAYERLAELGEENELKNRYMLIGYKDDENDTHTSTHTSTHASSIDIQPSSEWRKRSMSTHLERFNPPTFEPKNGSKTA